MKKLGLFCLSLLACFVSANAQIEGGGETEKVHFEVKHYNYEVSVGPRLGVGISTMKESDDLEVYDGSGMNFGGGIAGNIRFGSTNSRGQYLDGQGLLGFGVELNYKSLSVKTLGDDDLKLSYFEVPVTVQLYPWYNSKQLKNLYLEAGVTLAGSLSSSPDELVVNNTMYKTGDLKGFDVKPTIGIGYRFSKLSANDGFYVGARYYLGTSKLAGNFPGKISSAELTIGYLFKCIGTKIK